MRFNRRCDPSMRTSASWYRQRTLKPRIEPEVLAAIVETPMNPLLSSPTFRFHRGPPPSNDVEMLQTDVMRFFAILCLCLMAIFALVKALPMSPPADRPTIAPPPDLRAEAASLEKQIMAHKEKLAGLQARVADATEAIKNAEALAADAAVREQETLARLSRTRAELNEKSAVRAVVGL